MEYLLKVLESNKSLDKQLYLNGKFYATIRKGRELNWCIEHKSTVEEICDIEEVREGIISSEMSRSGTGIMIPVSTETVLKVFCTTF